jgi:hypothetical protein
MPVAKNNDTNTPTPRRQVLAVGLCGLLLGCNLLVPRGPSHVAQGKYYASGNPDYDAFFLELYRLQVDMGQAPIERRNIIAQLESDLDLPEQSSDDLLLAKVHQEAERLQASGTRLLLRIDLGTGGKADAAPAGGAATFLLDGKRTDPDVSRFVSAVEKATNALLQFRAQLEQDKTALDRLGVSVIELEGGVDSVFSPEGAGKPATVRQNLTDAGKIISLMRARASELSNSSEALTRDLAEASTTDDGRLAAPAPTPTPADEQQPEAKTEPEPKRKKPRARPIPRRRPQPTKPPAKAPDSGMEFEP